MYYFFSKYLRGSLFWVASGVVGLFQARVVVKGMTYVPWSSSLNLARRRLTPDFIFIFSGGGVSCVSYELCVHQVNF